MSLPPASNDQSVNNSISTINDDTPEVVHSSPSRQKTKRESKAKKQSTNKGLPLKILSNISSARVIQALLNEQQEDNGSSDYSKQSYNHTNTIKSNKARHFSVNNTKLLNKQLKNQGVKITVDSTSDSQQEAKLVTTIVNELYQREQDVNSGLPSVISSLQGVTIHLGKVTEKGYEHCAAVYNDKTNTITLDLNKIKQLGLSVQQVLIHEALHAQDDLAAEKSGLTSSSNTEAKIRQKEAEYGQKLGSNIFKNPVVSNDPISTDAIHPYNPQPQKIITDISNLPELLKPVNMPVVYSTSDGGLYISSLNKSEQRIDHYLGNSHDIYLQASPLFPTTAIAYNPKDRSYYLSNGGKELLKLTENGDLCRVSNFNWDYNKNGYIGALAFLDDGTAVVGTYKNQFRESQHDRETLTIFRLDTSKSWYATRVDTNADVTQSGDIARDMVVRDGKILTLTNPNTITSLDPLSGKIEQLAHFKSPQGHKLSVMGSIALSALREGNNNELYAISSSGKEYKVDFAAGTLEETGKTYKRGKGYYLTDAESPARQPGQGISWWQQAKWVSHSEEVTSPNPVRLPDVLTVPEIQTVDEQTNIPHSHYQEMRRRVRAWQNQQRAISNLDALLNRTTDADNQQSQRAEGKTAWAEVWSRMYPTGSLKNLGVSVGPWDQSRTGSHSIGKRTIAGKLFGYAASAKNLMLPLKNLFSRLDKNYQANLENSVSDSKKIFNSYVVQEQLSRLLGLSPPPIHGDVNQKALYSKELSEKFSAFINTMPEGGKFTLGSEGTISLKWATTSIVDIMGTGISDNLNIGALAKTGIKGDNSIEFEKDANGMKVTMGANGKFEGLTLEVGTYQFANKVDNVNYFVAPYAEGDLKLFETTKKLKTTAYLESNDVTNLIDMLSKGDKALNFDWLVNHGRRNPEATKGIDFKPVDLSVTGVVASGTTDVDSPFQTGEQGAIGLGKSAGLKLGAGVAASGSYTFKWEAKANGESDDFSVKYKGKERDWGLKATFSLWSRLTKITYPDFSDSVSTTWGGGGHSFLISDLKEKIKDYDDAKKAAKSNNNPNVDELPDNNRFYHTTGSLSGSNLADRVKYYPDLAQILNNDPDAMWRLKNALKHKAEGATFIKIERKLKDDKWQQVQQLSSQRDGFNQRLTELNSQISGDITDSEKQHLQQQIEQVGKDILASKTNIQNILNNKENFAVSGYEIMETRSIEQKRGFNITIIGLDSKNSMKLVNSIFREDIDPAIGISRMTSEQRGIGSLEENKGRALQIVRDAMGNNSIKRRQQFKTNQETIEKIRQLAINGLASPQELADLERFDQYLQRLGDGTNLTGLFDTLSLPTQAGHQYDIMDSDRAARIIQEGISTSNKENTAAGFVIQRKFTINNEDHWLPAFIVTRNSNGRIELRNSQGKLIDHHRNVLGDNRFRKILEQFLQGEGVTNEYKVLKAKPNFVNEFSNIRQNNYDPSSSSTIIETEFDRLQRSDQKVKIDLTLGTNAYRGPITQVLVDGRVITVDRASDEITITRRNPTEANPSHVTTTTKRISGNDLYQSIADKIEIQHNTKNNKPIYVTKAEAYALDIHIREMGKPDFKPITANTDFSAGAELSWRFDKAVAALLQDSVNFGRNRQLFLKATIVSGNGSPLTSDEAKFETKVAELLGTTNDYDDFLGKLNEWTKGNKKNITNEVNTALQSDPKNSLIERVSTNDKGEFVIHYTEEGKSKVAAQDLVNYINHREPQVTLTNNDRHILERLTQRYRRNIQIEHVDANGNRIGEIENFGKNTSSLHESIYLIRTVDAQGRESFQVKFSGNTATVNVQPSEPRSDVNSLFRAFYWAFNGENGGIRPPESIIRVAQESLTNDILRNPGSSIKDIINDKQPITNFQGLRNQLAVDLPESVAKKAQKILGREQVNTDLADIVQQQRDQRDRTLKSGWGQRAMSLYGTFGTANGLRLFGTSIAQGTFDPKNPLAYLQASSTLLGATEELLSGAADIGDIAKRLKLRMPKGTKAMKLMRSMFGGSKGMKALGGISKLSKLGKVAGPLSVVTGALDIVNGAFSIKDGVLRLRAGDELAKFDIASGSFDVIAGGLGMAAGVMLLNPATAPFAPIVAIGALIMGAISQSLQAAKAIKEYEKEVGPLSTGDKIGYGLASFFGLGDVTKWGKKLKEVRREKAITERKEMIANQKELIEQVFRMSGDMKTDTSAMYPGAATYLYGQHPSMRKMTQTELEASNKKLKELGVSDEEIERLTPDTLDDGPGSIMTEKRGFGSLEKAIFYDVNDGFDPNNAKGYQRVNQQTDTQLRENTGSRTLAFAYRGSAKDRFVNGFEDKSNSFIATEAVGQSYFGKTKDDSSVFTTGRSALLIEGRENLQKVLLEEAKSTNDKALEKNVNYSFDWIYERANGDAAQVIAVFKSGKLPNQAYWDKLHEIENDKTIDNTLRKERVTAHISSQRSVFAVFNEVKQDQHALNVARVYLTEKQLGSVGESLTKSRQIDFHGDEGRDSVSFILNPANQQDRTQKNNQITVTAGASVTYTVKPGDSWWGITQQYFGANNGHKYETLQEVNQLAAKRGLQPGDVLKIPMVTHQVSQGDTWWEIARSHYGDGEKYRLLQQANANIVKKGLQAGDVVRIPPSTAALGENTKIVISENESDSSLTATGTESFMIQGNHKTGIIDVNLNTQHDDSLINGKTFMLGGSDVVRLKTGKGKDNVFQIENADLAIINVGHTKSAFVLGNQIKGNVLFHNTNAEGDDTTVIDISAWKSIEELRFELSDGRLKVIDAFSERSLYIDDKSSVLLMAKDSQGREVTLGQEQIELLQLNQRLAGTNLISNDIEYIQGSKTITLDEDDLQIQLRGEGTATIQRSAANQDVLFIVDKGIQLNLSDIHNGDRFKLNGIKFENTEIINNSISHSAVQQPVVQINAAKTLAANLQFTVEYDDKLVRYYTDDAGRLRLQPTMPLETDTAQQQQPAAMPKGTRVFNKLDTSIPSLFQNYVNELWRLPNGLIIDAKAGKVFDQQGYQYKHATYDAENKKIIYSTNYNNQLEIDFSNPSQENIKSRIAPFEAKVLADGRWQFMGNKRYDTGRYVTDNFVVDPQSWRVYVSQYDYSDLQYKQVTHTDGSSEYAWFSHLGMQRVNDDPVKYLWFRYDGARGKHLIVDSATGPGYLYSNEKVVGLTPDQFYQTILSAKRGNLDKGRFEALPGDGSADRPEKMFLYSRWVPGHDDKYLTDAYYKDKPELAKVLKYFYQDLKTEGKTTEDYVR
ncbi:LysM peptidoglycan-binding domain-containing protein [Spartinivicinus poritis]|uniref:LysM peptidoglycan-binding domain-containing protein n=1 Tax=Spartinivicinus poritis TaxID=2994640 RepID=A0ABT5UGH6_9GAMM|nr:LysM peptidoglycan-binding domain-containing protein [Spartinivicinus sp. A2-2]MDE1465485.1 LysM peptidoglycan-binding domain-containing protein [Spartinivicinus sp. A2-2]